MPGGNKKKSKYVNVLSQEGKERLIVRMPGRKSLLKINRAVFFFQLGRSSCECQASKHKLIGNCRKCGRIVCDQEGSGPCFFCGQLVKLNEKENHASIGNTFVHFARFVVVKNDN